MRTALIVGPGAKGEGSSFLRRGLLFAAAAAGSCLWLWVYSSNAVAREADRLMQLEVSRGSFSGAVLVSRDGKVIFSKAYGLANATWRIPNTLHTRFHIGSITKTFTATLIMMLQRDGQLSVSDGICKYLTPCPAGWEPITVHHLLSHTSGIFNLLEVRDVEK